MFDSVLVHQLYNHPFPWANDEKLHHLKELYDAYLQLMFDTVNKKRLTCGKSKSGVGHARVSLDRRVEGFGVYVSVRA